MCRGCSFSVTIQACDALQQSNVIARETLAATTARLDARNPAVFGDAELLYTAAAATNTDAVAALASLRGRLERLRTASARCSRVQWYEWHRKQQTMVAAGLAEQSDAVANDIAAIRNATSAMQQRLAESDRATISERVAAARKRLRVVRERAAERSTRKSNQDELLEGLSVQTGALPRHSLLFEFTYRFV